MRRHQEGPAADDMVQCVVIESQLAEVSATVIIGMVDRLMIGSMSTTHSRIGGFARL